MDEFDEQLRARLERLEATLPLGRPVPSHAKRPEIRLTAGVVSGIAAVAMLAGAVAGATVISDGVRGHPGLFAPGGIFECTRIQEMTPRHAAGVLAELGYTVTWQVEDRDLGTSKQMSVAPSDGYIIDGVLEGANLVLVVERGAGVVPRDPVCER
jgi:hypothetical protein